MNLHQCKSKEVVDIQFLTRRPTVVLIMTVPTSSSPLLGAPTPHTLPIDVTLTF